MSIEIDFDDFPEGTRRVLAAAAEDIDTRGYATRGEVKNILGEDYQWARHRLNKLRDADVLTQSAAQVNGQTEKRYTLVDEHRETAETVREALAITGGDLPDDPGAEEFYAVVDEVASLKDRLDEEKGAREAAGDAVDGDLEERVAALEDDQDELKTKVAGARKAIDGLREGVVYLVQTNGLDVPPGARKAVMGALKTLSYTGRDIDVGGDGPNIDDDY